MPVTAGAGSGKTFVLTHRYFQILAEQKAGLDEILTITFTEKAANQMRKKIRDLIRTHTKGMADTGFPPVQKPGLKLPDREYWGQLLDDFEQSYISTIHGFCSRMLRESAIEMGLDPDFSIMDEHTTALRLPEITRRIVFQMIRNENEAVGHWLRYYSAGRIIDTMKKMIRKRVQYQGLEDHYLDTDGNPKDPEEQLLHLKNHYKREVEPLLDQFRNHPLWKELRTLLQGLTPLDRSDAFYPHYEALLDMIEQMDSVDDPVRLANLWVQLPDELKSKGSKKRWEGDFSRVKDLCKKFRDTVLEPELEGISLFDPEIELEGIRLAQSGAQIYSKVLDRYRRWKREQNFLDYDDLLIEAVRLLRNFPDIRQRYAHQFRHILVDEFQDTNPIQYELVNLLHTTDEDNSTKLFVVGDPKQSIYRFRGTEVSLFRQAEQALPQGEAQLTTSFRSRPALLQWFDACFAPVMGTQEEGRDELAPYEQRYQSLEAFRGEFDEKSTSVTAQIVETQSDADEDSVENRIQLEAAHIANWIQETVGTITVEEDGEKRLARYGDIALLFRRTTHIKQYEYAFQLTGIPYYTVAGKGLFQAQEVRDILTLLKTLVYPSDQISAVGTLRSAFFGMSDEGLFRLALNGYTNRWDTLFAKKDVPEELAESDKSALQSARDAIVSWRDLAQRTSPGRLIDTICNETGYLGIVGSGRHGLQRLRNVEQFLEFAYEVGRSQQSSLRGFVEYVETLRDETEMEEAVLHTGETNAVQLMTIHKAKGLEFPIVIVPNIDNTGASGMQQDFYSTFGWALAWNDPGRPADDQRVKPFLYHLISTEEARRDLAESRRLFYVANTRARDKLVLSGIANGKNALEKSIDRIDFEKDNWLRWTLGALTNLGWSPGEDSVALGEGTVTVLHHQHMDGEKLPGADEIVKFDDPENGTTSEDSGSILSGDEIIRRWRIPEPRKVLSEMKPTMFPVFRKDPDRFYREYILGIPELTPENVKADGLKGPEFGSLAHEILERFVKESMPEPEQMLVQILPQRQLAGESETESALRSMLERLQDSELGQLIRDHNARTEVTLLTSVLDIPMTGQIDLLLQTDEDRYIIIDYKTDAVDESGIEEKVNYYTPQILAYAYAVEESLGKSPEWAGLYFTRLNVIHRIDLPDNITGEMERLVREMIDFLENKKP